MIETTNPEPIPTWHRRALVAFTLIVCLACFFRDALLTRLTILYGDSYDGLIEIAILNHWYNVLAHGAAWNATGWFAPYGDTLGYNDSYIVAGLFFVAARLAGADPFIATFCSHVVMKAIGFIGMYVLLRRGLGVRTLLALAGAALFATANASLLHMHHAQLLAIGLIPWLMLAAIGVVRAALTDRPRALWCCGIAFALLFGLSALNAFYPVWFFCLFSSIFGIVGLIVAGPMHRARFGAAVRRYWPVLLALGAILALAMIPFLLTYLPKLAESGGHDWVRDVRRYLPIAQTFVNVGPGNLVWGAMAAGFHPGEQRFGIAPGLLALALAGVLLAARRRRADRLAWAIAVTSIVLIVLAMRWSTHFTLWRLVYETVPGASSVRVITRLLLFLLIPIIATAMLLLDRWRGSEIALLPVLAFLPVEQIQLAAPLHLDRAAHRQMLAGAGAPPAWCDTFAVVSARPTIDHWEGDRVAAGWGEKNGRALFDIYRHNVDAMLLASYYDRPTLNGNSTFNPPDWNFARPEAPDYLDRVRSYARRHPVGRVCVLDRRHTPPWSALLYSAAGGAGSRR